VPYALFTRIGNSDTPFLPTYHMYLEQTLRVTHGFLSLPLPTPPVSLDNGTIPPPLSLLVTTCELGCKIAHIEEAKHLEAEDALCHKHRHSESINMRLLVEPLPDAIPDPLPQGDIILPAQEKENGMVPLLRLCIPTPPSSSISSTDDEDTEIDIHSDTSCSSHSISPASEYPPLHCDPGAYALEMGCGEPYNFKPTENFDPSEFRIKSCTRFRDLPFTDGYFNGTDSSSKTGNYHTTCFPPPFEYNLDYQPCSPNSYYADPYLDAAQFYTANLIKELHTYQEELCDRDGKSCSEILMCYPPSIYYGRTAAYELHVYRADVDYRHSLPTFTTAEQACTDSYMRFMQY
jgi:hypothetical protein